MRSWLSLLRVSLIGLSVSACCTTPMIEPYRGEPFFASEDRLDEYEALMIAEQAPAIRAWVREADRVLRANNALRVNP